MELSSVINTKCESVELGNILCDIRYWISKLPLCLLNHVNMEKNQAADLLAKKANDADSMYVNFSLPPLWLINYLYYPFTI